MQKVRNFYFGNKQINNLTFLEYSKFVSDIAFNYNIDNSVKIHSESSTGRTYFYR